MRRIATGIPKKPCDHQYKVVPFEGHYVLGGALRGECVGCGLGVLLVLPPGHEVAKLRNQLTRFVGPRESLFYCRYCGADRVGTAFKMSTIDTADDPMKATCMACWRAREAGAGPSEGER